MSQTKARPDPVSVSDNAVKRIKQILVAENQPSARLRLSVSGGGCSGFQYGFALDEEKQPGDIEINREGTSVVVVDSMSLMYVLGSELDYVEDLTGSYFRVNNPQAVSSCGCGTSFSI